MKLRPSALPAWDQCPKFESGEARSFTLDGTLRHEALASMFTDPDGILQPDWVDKLDDQSIEGVGWAFDYIKLNANQSWYELEIEKQLILLDESFDELMRGTADYICGADIFDIKWRRRNYLQQMAAYGLGVIQSTEFEEVTIHILYMECMKVEKFKLTEAECLQIINDVLVKCQDPNAVPTPCDYCNWCKHHLYCSAVNDRVQAIVSGREDWELEQYHASRIETVEEMDKAISIAKVVKKWADAVEYHAQRMAKKRGEEFPTWEVFAKRGRRKVSSVTEAFSVASLPQEDFLNCCEVKFSRLVEKYMALHGIGKKAAERELENKLGEFCQREENQYQLRKKKNAKI